MLSLIHVIEWRGVVSPEQLALSDHLGGELTYAALAAEVERAAAGYAAAGIRPGDVVPIVARNQAGWVIAQFGLVRLGALPAAIDWRLAPAEVGALLAMLHPAAIVTDADCEPLVRQALDGADGARPPLFVLAGQSAGEPDRRARSGTQLAGESSVAAPVPRPVERLRGPEPCLLLHTSGTTGRPKLVPITHEQLISAVTFMKLEVPEAMPGARHLSALPLFHVAGQANLAYVMFTGGHLHVLGGFEPVGFVDELVARKIQLTQLVPALIAAVTREVWSRAEPPDLSQLTEIVYGASPIHPDLLNSAVRTLGCRFRQNYASSETGPLPISSLSPADHDPARGLLSTAGRPSLGWEVRLGAHSEIQVRGAAPLPGYWNDAEATSKVTTPDGFYRTGDVGVVDEAGYLTILDRLKDMIITGGENVFPAEVEAVLARHPAVADVAVIGVPDERWGESVHAVVVARQELDPAELIAWSRDRIAHFKCPSSVSVTDQLPRNATGKVLKSVLREPHWAGTTRQVS